VRQQVRTARGILLADGKYSKPRSYPDGSSVAGILILRSEAQFLGSNKRDARNLTNTIMNLESMLNPPFFKAYLSLLRTIKAPAEAKWILLYLIDRQTMKRWPVAYSIIGKDIGGVSPRTVRRMVDKLIKLGLVKIIDRKRDGMVYEVLLENAPDDQSQTTETLQSAADLSCKTESGQNDHSRVATVDTITDQWTPSQTQWTPSQT
jgi:hypothetical protein